MRGDYRKISTTQFNTGSKLDYKSSAQPDWDPKKMAAATYITTDGNHRYGARTAVNKLKSHKLIKHRPMVPHIQELFDFSSKCD